MITLKSCFIVQFFVSSIFIFSLNTFAQSDWDVLFKDSFDDGSADGWNLTVPGWTLETSQENHFFLNGKKGRASLLEGKNWLNYSLKCKIKMLVGRLHINFKLDGRKRYFLGFEKNGLELEKHTGSLTFAPGSFVENRWYELEIRCNQSRIEVFVNDKLMIDIIDDDPIGTGSIAFEIVGNSHFHIDDILVTGETVKTIKGYKWHKTGGPPGGLGYDVRIHPKNSDILFVTDNPSGVNKSIDGGKTWFQSNEGITIRRGSSMDAIPIFSLTIDPLNPNIIWAGTQDAKGIFRSDDLGKTWERKDWTIEGGDELSFRGFAIHPQNSKCVLAAAEIITGEIGPEGFDKTKGRIYKTIDGGENWYTVWQGDNLARVLIYDYKNPDIVYCSTGIFDRDAYNLDMDRNEPGGVGILKSIDGGENWFQINKGIENLYIGFLEMHPDNSNILFAAAFNSTVKNLFDLEGAIYRTYDGGNNWDCVQEADFTVVTFSKSNPNIIYAGGGSAFYTSHNSGDSWQKFEKKSGGWGPPGVIAHIPISAVVDPEDPLKLFVNNYGGGNFITTDGCKSWQNQSRGYTGAEMRDISMNPVNHAQVFAVGRSGPFKSMNGGDTWMGIARENTTVEGFRIVVFPDNPDEILAGDAATSILIKSYDSGSSWNKVFVHESAIPGYNTMHTFSAIKIASSNNNIVYAGMTKAWAVGALDPEYGKSYGMFKSLNRGESWIEINNGLEHTQKAINVIAIHPNDPDIVYIGTLQDGIFKSVDGGTTWRVSSNGLGFNDVRSLAIDPKNPDILYAGSGDGAGIYKSTNAGELWVDANNNFQINCPSYLLPIGGTSIGINTEKPNRVFRRTYNNVSWTKILDIVIDPINSQNVYIADYSNGVHLSQDYGNSWMQINAGLEMRAVNSMDISPDGRIIYAGTSGGGVYRLTVGKNNAPQILNAVPSLEDTIKITHGDSLLFSIDAFDLDADSLSYVWTINGGKQSISFKSMFFYSQDYPVGDHSLKVSVSDTDTSVTANWNINILENIQTDVASGYSENINFSLEQNHPNPFNSKTIISYALPKPTRVIISIYNLNGQLVSTIFKGKKQAGFHSVTWDAAESAAGTYFIKLTSGNFVQTRKCILLK